MSQKYNDFLGIRVDTELLLFLDDIAVKRGLCTSSLARTILKKFMEDSLNEKN